MRSRILPFLAIILLATESLHAVETAGPSTDVTAKITPLVIDNKLTFTVDTDKLGDPSPGDTKKLRLEYTADGKDFTRFFAESQDVSLASTTGPLTIKSAIYGVFPNPVDVTPKVQEAVADDAVSIKADNDVLGVDPSPGDAKELAVRFTQGGSEQTLKARESETLTIKKQDGAKLIILEATYGEALPYYDVTDRLLKAMHDGKLSIKADNKLLGDPAVGLSKELRVEYTVAGSPYTITVKENDPLTLPTSSDPSGELVITKATYGVLPPKL